MALKLRATEVEEMTEACPGLDLGPFCAEELASVAQRHALLVRSVKLGAKQSFHLSMILSCVGKRGRSWSKRLTDSAVAIAAFVGRPMLSYRTIGSILGLLIR